MSRADSPTKDTVCVLDLSQIHVQHRQVSTSNSTTLEMKCRFSVPDA